MLKSKTIKNKNKCKLQRIENKYQKIKLAGQGTFGKVYLAMNKKTNEIVALKQVVQDVKYKNRELGIFSLMDHPNIIQMKDYYIKIEKQQQILCLIMEYMETSLYQYIKQQRKFKNPIQLLKRKIIAFQMFKGLYYLAINNVCHRDLKPPNILLNTKNLQVKICDFGSAKIIQKKQGNVAYICSRYYRAPQLILNSSVYGCQIDMWSAGCILVQLMTLQPLFPGDSSLQQLIQIIKLLGTPKKQVIKQFSPENANIKLPKVKPSDLSKILQRYQPDMLQLDLIQKILTYDTKKRLTPYQALIHPYFKNIQQISYAKQLPDLTQFLSLKNKFNHQQIYNLQILYQTQYKTIKKQRFKDIQQQTRQTFHRKTQVSEESSDSAS